MDEAEGDVLAFMSYQREHWPQLASTNTPERVMNEIKRRSNVVGIFPNDAAIMRLVGTLLIEQGLQSSQIVTNRTEKARKAGTFQFAGFTGFGVFGFPSWSREFDSPRSLQGLANGW